MLSPRGPVGAGGPPGDPMEAQKVPPLRSLCASVEPPGPTPMSAGKRPQHHTSEQGAISHLASTTMKGTGGKIVETCELVANEEN